MDLVQLREDIVNKDVTSVEKAHLFTTHKAALNLSHSQLFFMFPPPIEVDMPSSSLSYH